MTPVAADIGALVEESRRAGMRVDTAAITADLTARALRAGASGFLLKDTAPTEIVAAINRVAAGDAQLSPSVTRRLIAHATTGARRSDTVRERLAPLTDREREVASAIGEGATNAEIAARLFLSVPTVKSHVSAIFAALGVTNRVQVALLVHGAGPDPADGSD